MEGWAPSHVEFTMSFRRVDEDTARNIQTKGAMVRRSVFCSCCARLFEDGDVVYRKRGRPGWNPGSQPLQAFCSACVGEWHPSWLEHARKPVPCPGSCGVHVSHWYRDRYSFTNGEGAWTPSIAACSSYCAEKARAARRRVEHEPRTCKWCGQPFVPKRSDAKTCKDACRQAVSRSKRAALVPNRDEGKAN
jgi:hypothetical protein